MPKMKFNKDAFVDGKCIAQAGQTVEIAEDSVERWQRRGAEVVEDGKELDQQPKAKMQMAAGTTQSDASAEAAKSTINAKGSILSNAKPEVENGAKKDEAKQELKGKNSKVGQKASDSSLL